MINKEIPIYELRINPDEDSFVSGIALVEHPAIESNFIAFSKDNNKAKVSLEFASNDERMELFGLAMIPNQLIDRKAEDDSMYKVVFSEKTIRYIAQVFGEKGLFNQTNINHTTVPANSFIFQSYLTDDAQGVKAPNGIKGVVPSGSWVIGVKVKDVEVWNSIKAGKIKGFSVEGMFEEFEIKQLEQLSKDEQELAFQELEELEKLYKNIIG